MAQAMLRLLANPKITAVFCDSLILSPQFSVFSLWFEDRPGHALQKFLKFLLATHHSSPATPLNPVKRLLDFLDGIPQHYRPPVRAAHRAIGFRQRVQQPL